MGFLVTIVGLGFKIWDFIRGNKDQAAGELKQKNKDLAATNAALQREMDVSVNRQDPVTDAVDQLSKHKF